MVSVADPERIDQVVELAHEQLDRPEIRAAVREVGAPSVADLVVVHDSAIVAREIRQGEQAIVDAARATVKHDQGSGRRRVIRPQRARDSIPGLRSLALETERNRPLAARNHLLALRRPDEDTPHILRWNAQER